MANVFVSPGVYTQEIDESFIPSAADAGVGAALIGLSSRGPAYRPVTVTSFGQFKETFGGLNVEQYAPYAARSYLRNGDSLTFVKLAGRSATGVGTGGFLAFPDTSGGAATASLTSTSRVLAVVRRRDNTTNDISMSGTPTSFGLSADGLSVTGLSLDSSSPRYIKKVVGTNPKRHTSGELFPNLYVDAVFDFGIDDFGGEVRGDGTYETFFSSVTSQTGDTQVAVHDELGGFDEPTSPTFVSQNYGGNVFEMFKVYQLTNSPASVKVSITNVKKAVNSTDYPTFTLLVRASGDTDEQPQILETFEDTTMDPSAAKYIARMIGDRRPQYDFSTNPPELTFDGDYPNVSKFVRVEVIEGAPNDAHPSGFKGYPTVNIEPQNRDGDAGTISESVVNTDVIIDGTTKTITSANGGYDVYDPGDSITLTIADVTITVDNAANDNTTDVLVVPDSSVLAVGSEVTVDASGNVGVGTTVLAIIDPTSVQLSATKTALGAAGTTDLDFQSPNDDQTLTVVTSTDNVITVSESTLVDHTLTTRSTTVAGISDDAAQARGYVKYANVEFKLNQLNNRSELSASTFIGVDFSKTGLSDRLKATIAQLNNGLQSIDKGVLMVTESGESGDGNLGSLAESFEIADAVTNNTTFSSSNNIRLTAALYGGSDGFDPRQDLRNSLNDGSLTGDFEKAIQMLSNPQEVDFNLIALPGVHSSESGGGSLNRMIDMVTERSDAFAVIDLADASTSGAGLALSVSNAITEANKFDTNYAAAYYPWVRINDPENNRLVWVPPSVEVLGAYSFNDRVSQPWFAPAGFTRGGLDSVLEARRRLTQAQRDSLYAENINPIATFPGQGIVIFGQKTLQKKQSVLDRVNVRRMLLEVRKTIAGFSRLFVFEPNNANTRGAILSRVNAYLGTVQAANGLTQFRAILDESTTTPDLVDRNIIKGKIQLQPTQAAEIIIFDFTVDGSGAIFDEG